MTPGLRCIVFFLCAGRIGQAMTWHHINSVTHRLPTALAKGRQAEEEQAGGKEGGGRHDGGGRVGWLCCCCRACLSLCLVPLCTQKTERGQLQPP